ncbi:phosphotransferase enzyme family protein [Tenggerimyces flavus]|uniref:Phosphotransferase enzyme family protein n=1 Tax=Tenggerimyces flavus TaxID=1708749 RepID=A0ABV7YR24_9ACTN|nr:aminoglycoside phosphotransferase family protein [Tenggerimyces flavus]MBM7784640.1 thiamine kinase-like enzyme [Tenggerimyces flavus]
MTWADEVAEAFGLADVVRAEEHTYRSSQTWRFETADGATYLVKEVPADWRRQLEAANAFEHRAAAAGLPMPRPVGGLVDVGGRLVRVSTWHDEVEHPPTTDPRWLGRTLATLHEVQPLDASVPPEPQWYGIEPAARWEERLELAQARKAFRADLLSERLPFIIAETARIADAFDQAGDYVFTHRDVEPWNVLHTRDGTQLIDWDTAGPDSARLEAAHAILDFARNDGGDPDPAYVAAAREAYGRTFEGDHVLARRLGLMIARMAERVDVLTGLAHAGSMDLADAEQRVRDRLDGLPAFAADLREWSALFRV